jgi:hypothetical protein
MIKLELTEDELRRVLKALRSQELAVEDEIRNFMNPEAPWLGHEDAATDHCKVLKQISQECFDVAEKIRVQWRGTW